MEVEESENGVPYAILNQETDEENQISFQTNHLYNQTISTYNTNNINQCIICFNDDISMNLMYTCINCKECLICRQCVIKIIFKKNNGCPVCRTKNWCKNSSGQLVIFKHKSKKRDETTSNTNEFYFSIKCITYIVLSCLVMFILYSYQ